MDLDLSLDNGKLDTHEDIHKILQIKLNRELLWTSKYIRGTTYTKFIKRKIITFQKKTKIT